MDKLNEILTEWSDEISQKELLFHGSGFDFDIIDSIKSNQGPLDTLYYGFDICLSLAILTEKVDTDYGYLYCIEPQHTITLPSGAVSFTEPLFFKSPQKVGDCESNPSVWGTYKEIFAWDKNMLLITPDSLLQQVEIPNKLMGEIKLIYKKKININKLKESIKQRKTDLNINNSILDDISE